MKKWLFGLALALVLFILPGSAWADAAKDNDYTQSTDENGAVTYNFTTLGTSGDYTLNGWAEKDNVTITLPTSPNDGGSCTIYLNYMSPTSTLTINGTSGVTYNLSININNTGNVSTTSGKVTVNLNNVSINGVMNLPSRNVDCDVIYNGTVAANKIAFSGYNRTINMKPANNGSNDKLTLNEIGSTYSNYTDNTCSTLILSGNITVKTGNICNPILKIENANINFQSPTKSSARLGGLPDEKGRKSTIEITNSTIKNVSSIATNFQSAAYVHKESSLSVKNSNIEFVGIDFVSDNAVRLGDAATITIDSSTIKGSSTQYYGGIGGAFKTLEIKNRSNIEMTTAYSSAIGPYNYSYQFNRPSWFSSEATITIDDSTVNAASEYGASIGTPSIRHILSATLPAIQVCIKGSSQVTATSGYGAAIGTGYASENPSNLSQSVNVTISGDADVTAVSRYGQAIGSGLHQSSGATGWPIFGPGPAGTWDDENDVSGEAHMRAANVSSASNGAALTSLLAASNRAANDGLRAGASQADASAQTSAVNADLLTTNSPSLTSTSNRADAGTLVTNKGTLKIEGDAKVKAESGLKAIGLTVSAETPMMEYTLANDTDIPSVTTPINRAVTNGTSANTNDPGVPSYNLRPDFRSLAFWPVNTATYTLTYGSGPDPDPLLDVTSDVPTYATTYEVNTTNSVLNAFKVTRQQKITGKITLMDSSQHPISGSVVKNTYMAVDISGITPSMSGGQYLTYQWYKNGEAIANETSSNFTPSEIGVYYCAVTASTPYRGTINSEAVTVVENETTVAPDAPTVTNPSTQITANSITLDNAGDGYLYSRDGGKTWVSDTTFSNLARNTAYSFVQKNGTDGAVSAAATFSTLSGKPDDNVLVIDYVKEKFSLTDSTVTAYTNQDCTTALEGDSITNYIGQTVYLKFNDVQIEDSNYDEVVTAVAIPSRGDAPRFTSANITCSDMSLSFRGESGVTYAIFEHGSTTVKQQVDGDGSTITFSNLSSNTTYDIRARYKASNDSPNQHFYSKQAFVSVSTTQPLTHLGISPGANSYPYDGEPHAFAFTVNASGVAASSFTVKYYQDNDIEKATEQAPTARGIYNVIVSREATGNYAAYSGTFTMEITQGVQTAPSAPEAAENGIATNSITLKAIDKTALSTDVEYCYLMGSYKDLPADATVNWTKETTFSDLQSSQMYTFFARYAASSDGNYAPSPASAGTVIATLSTTPDADKVVTINYAEETLNFDSIYEVSVSANFTNTIASGESIKDYIPAANQSAKTLYVREKAKGNIPASDPDSFTIPARPAAPTAPTEQSKTDKTITINTSNGVQYSIDGGENWHTPTDSTYTFSDLAQNTDYTITARNPADTTSSPKKFASEEISLAVKTKSSAPDAPTVSGSYTVSTTYQDKFVYTITAIEGAEYSKDGTNWQESNVFDNIDPQSEVTFYARIKETATAMPGSPGSVKVKFNLLKGEGSVTMEDWVYGQTASNPAPTSATNGIVNATYVYKTQGADDDTYSNEVPTAAGSYTVKATFPATAVYDAVTATANFTINQATITGSVSIDGDAVFGETLTAKYTGGADGETLSYAWYRGDGTTPIGQNETYTLTADDVEKTIRVVVSGTGNYTGAKETSTSSTVEKATPVDPGSGVGYTIDYDEEKVAVTDAAYELSADQSTVSESPLQVTPGKNVYIRLKETDTHKESGWVTVTIPPRPAQPSNLTPVNESFAGENDGKIAGVDTTMEYRKADDTTWTSCTGDEITGLAPGTYQVRVKAVEGKSFASIAAEITITTGAKRTYNLSVTAPSFDSVLIGYRQPEAKAITITSSGNSDATIDSVSLSGDTNAFILNTTAGATVPAGESISSYTIQPAAGLDVGTYTATIIVTYNDSQTATAQVSFTVSVPSTPIYRVSIGELTHGSVSSNHLWATAGTKVTLTIDPDGGYALADLVLRTGDGRTISYVDNGDGTITFTMPGSDVAIEAIFTEAEPAPEPGDEWPFVDVSASDWYYDAVRFVYEAGIMGGTSATTFEPQTATTRAMIVSMLHRIENTPAAAAADFTDVAAGDWFAEPVAWAASVGVVGGYPDGSFQPNKRITREELASILYRYAEWKGYDVSARADLSRYTDAPSPWAAEVMSWANAEGLITGRTATTIDAQATLTRAETAAIFQRFLID